MNCVLKGKIIICLCLALLVVALYCNWKYEVIAIHPFYGNENHELKVMTWNVHCPVGADNIRQRKIAKLILKEDADFVQLNEYYQDSCLIIDSLLKLKYPFTEEYQSHRICGDIFYSKKPMNNSGHVHTPISGIYIQTIMATIAIGRDSVQIFGIHMATNHYDDVSVEDEKNLIKKGKSAYGRYKDSQIPRCIQAEWTRTEMKKTNNPMIVMGDMNDFNKSKPLVILCTEGLADSWWEGGFGYGATYHEGWMRLRIDHILHSDKLKLQSIKVIDTNLSDHNPVVAEFSVSKYTL